MKVAVGRTRATVALSLGWQGNWGGTETRQRGATKGLGRRGGPEGKGYIA